MVFRQESRKLQYFLVCLSLTGELSLDLSLKSRLIEVDLIRGDASLLTLPFVEVHLIWAANSLLTLVLVEVDLVGTDFLVALVKVDLVRAHVGLMTLLLVEVDLIRTNAGLLALNGLDD